MENKLVNYKGRFKIYTDPKDTIVSPRIIFGSRDEKSLEIIKKIVKKGDIVMDVGAHIGFITLHLSKMVGEDGIVYTFEPSNNNYSFLLENIKINNYTNVLPFHTAVSNFSGKTNLFLTEGERHNTGDYRLYKVGKRNSEEVNVTTLDNFIKEHPQKISFIKIDTQGSEFKIFKGATNLLKEMKPILFFEYWPEGLKGNNDDPIELLEFLESFGYKFYQHSKEFKIGQNVKSFIDLFAYPNKG